MQYVVENNHTIQSFTKPGSNWNIQYIIRNNIN